MRLNYVQDSKGLWGADWKVGFKHFAAQSQKRSCARTLNILEPLDRARRKHPASREAIMESQPSEHERLRCHFSAETNRPAAIDLELLLRLLEAHACNS